MHHARTRLGRGDGRSRRPRGGRGCGGARPCASQLPEELRVLQERHSPVRPHVAGWHGTKPENATISGDKENFYNTIAQALTADNKPDPNGCGRVKLLDWIRKRRPDLLPVARLIVGTPSFIRLVKAEGALRLPSADGDDLDFSAADWDPLSLECPDYNDPNYANDP